MRRWMLLLLLFASMPLAQAKTCLVLSGGGARGIAHVGVIKVLERERVPIDCIVGTSMGAVIGSLYASGMSADELDAAVQSIDWRRVFSDASERTDRPLRARQQDRTFLVGAAIGYREGRFALPRSLLQGQRLGLALRGLLLPVAGVDDFDRLPTPFRAVATDLETGEIVVMGEGDLASAVRASMAVPGIFPPVLRDDRLLSDGGTSSNLPIGIARELGATRIIAVDISAPLRTREALNSPLSITDQMLTAMMRRQTALEVASLTPRDVLITPQLGDVGSTDFVEAASSAVAPGVAAAEAAIGTLAGLASGEAEYAAWTAQRRAALPPPLSLARVVIDNESPLRESVLRAYLSEYPDDHVDRSAIEADIARLYGLGEFEQIDYSIQRGEDGTELHLRLREKAWGDGSLRFGLRLEDDFDGSSNFDFGARLRGTEVNDHGAEWVADAQIGKTTRLGYEWLQPLDRARRWWVLPRADYSARNLPVFLDGQRALELRGQSLQLRADLGRWIGASDALRLGLFRRSARYTSRTSAVLIPTQQEGAFGLELGYEHDAQDDSQFPQHGSFVSAVLRRHLDVAGGDFDAALLSLRASRAFAVGEDHRLVLQTRLQYADDDVPTDEVGFLGGFLDLSGLSEDALFGRHLLLTQAIYHHSLTQLFDRYRVFAGGSLEAGNAWQNERDIGLDSLLWGGSVFVASESPLGALYFGYGHAEGGENSLYLFIGRPF